MDFRDASCSTSTSQPECCLAWDIWLYIILLGTDILASSSSMVGTNIGLRAFDLPTGAFANARFLNFAWLIPKIDFFGVARMVMVRLCEDQGD